VTLVGGISHVAIVTTDLDRLASFYVDLFDATVVQVDDTPFGRVGIVRLGSGTGLNLFEITDNDHAAGLPTMFDRGHLDHLGLDVADDAAFWTLRDRLIAGGHSTGDVTDFGPVIGLDFTDPDGMVGEVNLVLDATLTGSHPPIPYDTPSTT
jgi:catechol 2,3-dioxygenase-like lactoylglutathione lyase family enzyme